MTTHDDETKTLARGPMTGNSEASRTASQDAGRQDAGPPTPGPWHVRTDAFNAPRRKGICASVMDATLDVYLAEVWSDFEWEPGDGPDIPPVGTGLANARLIAAAPDLLDACRAVLADGFLDRPSLNKCRAAIAKADGR